MSDLEKIMHSYLANLFGKKYGEYLYSGTLAVETALACSGVNPNDYVLIQDNICYRVLFAVLRTGAIPLIVNPINGIILTDLEISKVLKKYKIKAIILVHNLGIPVDIKSIKKICKNRIKIIEDASQAWDIKSKGNCIGKFSDYVIASFGKTKPLSLGIGGGLFSDDPLFKQKIDYYDNSSRKSTNLLLPYLLPSSFSINFDKLIKKANRNVNKKRVIAHILMNNLKNTNIYFWKPEEGDDPSWHRFPIWVYDNNIYRKILSTMTKYKIFYEIPHKVNLNELPILKKYNFRYMNFMKEKKYFVYIKTKETLKINIMRWVKEINSL